jgi:hypothetical protein
MCKIKEGVGGERERKQHYERWTDIERASPTVTVKLFF